MIGLTLKEALKLQDQLNSEGRHFSIHRETGSRKFYLLPIPMTSCSIWSKVFIERDCGYEGKRSSCVAHEVKS